MNKPVVLAEFAKCRKYTPLDSIVARLRECGAISKPSAGPSLRELEIQGIYRVA